MFTYQPYIKIDYNHAMNYINQINSSDCHVFIQLLGICKTKAHKSGHMCEIILYFILLALGKVSLCQEISAARKEFEDDGVAISTNR